jgi:hypothetical protein
MKQIATNNKSLKNITLKPMPDISMKPDLNETIRNMVVIVRNEIMAHKKSLDITDGAFVENIITQIREENCSFSCEKECNEYYYNVVRTTLWSYVNEKESSEIINQLKSGDLLFSQKFFYGTNNNKCNISRFRSKILAQIKQTYHVDMSIQEFGNIVYNFLWDKGTWSVLDNYAGKGSFFCWLERVCYHEVIKALEEMKIINVSRERTTRNTRLLGPSVSPDIWYLIISDIMQDGRRKNLLMAKYVYRKNEVSMEEEFNMNTEELRKEIKKAEDILKDRLICSDSYYETLVLRDKSPRNIEVSEEYIKDFAKWIDEQNDISQLADVFGVDMNNGELSDKIVKFLYDFSEKMKWTDDERIIWQLRFIENISPVELAERYGKTRTWIDQKYSKINIKFRKAIREWWKENAQ